MLDLFGLGDAPNDGIPSHAPSLRPFEVQNEDVVVKHSYTTMVGLANCDRVVVTVSDSLSATETVFARLTGVYSSELLRYRANLVNFKLGSIADKSVVLPCTKDHLDDHVCIPCGDVHVKDHPELHEWTDQCLPCDRDHATRDSGVNMNVCTHDIAKCSLNHYPDNSILIELDDYVLTDSVEAIFRWADRRVYMRFSDKWRPVTGLLVKYLPDGFYTLNRENFVDV